MRFILSRVLLAALALAFVCAPLTALAEYPTKPITLVAPYGPGGASDLASRTLAAAVNKYIGQPVVVINRTGAGGVTGSAFVSKGRPDGYTLLLGRVGCSCLVPALNKTIPYKWNDFTFLGMLELNPFVYVVQADSPYKTLKDLVDAIKKNPGKLSFSNSGPSGLLAVGSYMLLEAAGLPQSAATGIPYKGGGGAKTALMGGHVDFLGINLAPVLDQIQAGKLRALAVTTPERYPAIKDVPTVREAGFPALETAIGWSALLGPPKMDKAAVAKWEKALAEIKKDKAWNKITKSLGSIPYITDGAGCEAYIKGQYETYDKLGAKMGITIK
jgi:tripartite-type tricarboxylate transporter receptor subunit TctC